MKTKKKRTTLIEWRSCCDNPDGWELYTEVTFGTEYNSYTPGDLQDEVNYMREAIHGEAWERWNDKKRRPDVNKR
jgi:hypothetical protein